MTAKPGREIKRKLTTTHSPVAKTFGAGKRATHKNMFSIATIDLTPHFTPRTRRSTYRYQTKAETADAAPYTPYDGTYVLGTKPLKIKVR